MRLTLAGLLSWLADMRRDESLRQFGGYQLLHQALNNGRLDTEICVHPGPAISLLRAGSGASLSFLKALWPMITSVVLVETFEQGQLVQKQSACHTLSWSQIRVRAGCGAT